MKRKTQRLLRDAFFSSLLSSLLIFLLIILLLNIRFFNPVHQALTDFSFLDVFYSEEFDNSAKINTDIVLINASGDRADIYQLLQRTVEAEPRAIGLDVIFKETKNPYLDSLLADLLNKHDIVTAYEFDEESIIRNHPIFGSQDSAGFVNYNFDKNATVIREFEGLISREGEWHTSFAAQLAKQALKERWDSLNYDERLKRSHTINYLRNLNKFHVLELEDFNDFEQKKLLKDKIVILGYLGDPLGDIYDIEDKFFTPLNPHLVGRSDADMFGAVIHANIVNMLINDEFLITISDLWLIVITFLLMYLSTIFYMKINRKYKISFRTRKRIYQFVVSVSILILSFWLFKTGIVIKPAVLIVGIILAGSYFKYYKHLTRYINSKLENKWKTYLK